MKIEIRLWVFIVTILFTVFISIVGTLLFTGITLPQKAEAGLPTVKTSFTLIIMEWGFNQTKGGPEIHVKVGEMVTIRLINQGKIPHNFDVHTIEGEDVGWEGAAYEGLITPGEEVVISFTPDKPGKYIYMCHVPGHMELGMWGYLIVES